jgi:2-oxoisovalerate dehydrogenase E1 component
MTAKYRLDSLERYPALTPERLILAYRDACLTRFHVQRVVQECSKGNIKFAIWGPGEEVHGAAEALAYHEVANPDAFGIIAHYRSAGLLSTWARLRGYQDFHLDHMRQQLSRATDPWSGGRQMTAHFNMMAINHLPVQSAVGMQMSKAVGYLQGLRRKGHTDSFAVAICGDGTMAESDFHEGMQGATILDLPLLINVTDNGVAISVTPKDGRGIRDLQAYAKAFGFEYFSCNGNDFLDCYNTAKAAALYCRDHQRPAILYTHSLPRLNGHSNAGSYDYDFEQFDPLLDFGEALVEAGVLAASDIYRRNENSEGKSFYARHELGGLAKECDDYIVSTLEIAGAEPEPTPESAFEHIRDPYPDCEEAPLQGRTTVISLNGAIRAALRDILRDNPMTWIYGQDVGARGGVMQATAGLLQQFPDQVRDAPINEPMIVGTAMGFALHEGATAIPEIQFSDYSLNTLHWLVHLGNILWSSNGTCRTNVILRLPVEPLHGGSIYHSMCMEGFYGSIPGLTIVAPTTSRDFYGLLRSAADYTGPVLVFESKGLYRMPLGDAFPGEPTDPKEVAALKRAIGFQGLIPDIDPSFRVPLGKAAIRRSGSDLTIVTWGRCTLFCAEAVETLAGQGISVELIDLRTIVPPDLETVLASCQKTGHLLVVHEDRVFASIGREIQGAVSEATNGLVTTRVLGQDAVPGIPQNIHLEHHLVVSPRKIVVAAEALLASGRQRPQVQAAALDPQIKRLPARVLWTPNRHFVS